MVFAISGILRRESLMKVVSCFPIKFISIYLLSFFMFIFIFGFTGCKTNPAPGSTFCNPLNLDYRISERSVPFRQCADPVIVFFKGYYFLFGTQSDGYWYSEDFGEWTHVKPVNMPSQHTAPSVFAMDDSLYFTAFDLDKIYSSKNPISGLWQEAGDITKYRDPAFFLDDDGKVYVYYGCSPDKGIRVVEVDPESGFKEISDPVLCLESDISTRGWERRGDECLGFYKPNGVFDIQPWVEGAWMTKHDDIYYLQYAAPGTCYKSYADGVFTSHSPKGPFVYEKYNPFCHKPSGFIRGAGHGNIFVDKNGNYWKTVTMVVSVAHKFERRVGVFPLGFRDDGQIYTLTYLGDYPQYLPGLQPEPHKNNLVGWMLLSYKKKSDASSSLDNHPAVDAFMKM